MSKRTAFMTTDDRERYQKQSESVYIASSMQFLTNTNGWRPECVHTLIGASGGGKSTMVRTILRDFLFNKENATQRMKVLVWLSEESVDEFRRELSFGIPEHERLMDAHLISEMDMGGKTSQDKKTMLTETVAQVQPTLFLFDNITTSALYQELTSREQANFCQYIKHLTIKSNMATLLVAHTGAEVHEGITRMINHNDVRGSKGIVNISQFIYILQTFKVRGSRHPFLFIDKSRGQHPESLVFYLEYNKALRSFQKDRPTDFEKFKEVFNARDRLDGPTSRNKSGVGTTHKG
jgi:ABC-type iron transport system FetAB ATPase subunit